MDDDDSSDSDSDSDLSDSTSTDLSEYTASSEEDSKNGDLDRKERDN